MTFDVWKQAKLQNAYKSLKEYTPPPDKDTTLEDLTRLAGINKNAENEESNISITGNEKARLMKQNNIQPGTDAWFKLWFSRPYLTGEKPIGK